MNVTLGIPRLREILMVASENIKTPSMDIPFREGVTSKEMDRIRVKLNKVVLADLLEKVEVTERIQLQPTRARIVDLRFELLPYKTYKKDFCVKPDQVLQYFEQKFINKVLMPVLAAVSKEKKVVVETAIDSDGKKKKGNEDGNDEEDDKAMEAAAEFGMGGGDESDNEMEEGEGTDVDKKLLRQGDAEYEELEDEEIEMNEQIRKDLGEEYFEEDVDNPDTKENILATEQDEGIGEDEEEENDNVIPVRSKAEIQKEAMQSGEAARRKASVLSLVTKSAGLATIHDYSYDTEKQTWFCLTLSFAVERKRVDFANVLKQAATKGIIHEVKGLKRAFIVDNKNAKGLKTDGINIKAMFNFDQVLDIQRLVCNNIHDMARFYGIEAANKTIVSEISGVFKVYGIEVDPRHLNLIADFMTFDGVYKPFNRIGMEYNTSPLQQMTFETALGFLRSATLGGKTDHLNSPSACVVLGKPVKGGTGAFSLLQKLC